MTQSSAALMYADAVATFIRLMVRFSPELHGWLSQLAEQEHRSLNGQIAYMLDQIRVGGYVPANTP